MTFTLVLFRHGKSRYPKGVEDIERPLGPRGLTEVPRAGEWVRRRVGQCDAILCSPATRCRETLELARIDGPVRVVDELYRKSHRDYLNTISSYGQDAKTLLIVGHEPALSATALTLATDQRTVVARRIQEKYPTASVAVLKGDRPWNEIGSRQLFLAHFFIPRSQTEV